MIQNTFLKRTTLLTLAGASLFFAGSFAVNEGGLSGIWPVVDQNIYNSGVNSYEDTLNIHNVPTLVRGWSNYQFGIDNAVQAHPSVSFDGVLYYSDALGNVTALDADTGAQVWQTNLAGQHFVVTPAITQDFVYVANSSIYCLNRLTGEVIWSTAINTGPLPYASNPTVVEDLVIIGVGTFINENRGAVIAYNRFTGNIAWEHWNTSDQTLPNPPYGPGAGVYSTPGIDPEHKMLYVGCGEVYSGVAGPLTDSLLAIDYRTGQLVWSYQYQANDVWDGDLTLTPGTYDHDVAGHPNVFTLEDTIHGKLELVGAGSKGGQYMIFDRHQYNNKKVTPLVNIMLDQGSWYGAMQGAAVVKDGVLYIASQAYIDANGNRISLDNLNIPGQQEATVLAEFVPNSSLKTMALDIRKLIAAGNTGGAIPPEAIIWTNITPGICSANPLSFANGVLYQASFVGWVRALNPHTGVEIWRDTPVPVVDPVYVPFPGFITTGVTVANGRLYVGLGLDVLGQGFPFGGLVSYQLPQQ